MSLDELKPLIDKIIAVLDEEEIQPADKMLIEELRNNLDELLSNVNDQPEDVKPILAEIDTQLAARYPLIEKVCREIVESLARMGI